MKFYVCQHCKNIVVFMNDSGVPVVCCGEPMKELVPNTVDAAKEKHVPVVEKDGNKVKVTVGSVLHPMEDKHYIQFCIVETNKGYMKKEFKPGETPVAEFLLPEGEEVVAVYEYCNLHGLWKA